MPYPYLVWLTIFVWVPTLILWLFFFPVLRRYPQTIFRCVVGACIVSIPWDIIAVKTRIWEFPEGCCLPVNIASLPLEEYLFIVTVAVYISTTTLVLREKLFPAKV